MNQKLISQTPLDDITLMGIQYEKVRYLYADDIKQKIRDEGIEFILADIGAPLQIIKDSAVFDFWKKVKDNIVTDVEAFSLDDYPEGFAYIASEWTSVSDKAVILLEKYH